MPNAENWQGDVLRDLRGGAQPPAQGQTGPQQQQPASGPAGQAPAHGHPQAHQVPGAGPQGAGAAHRPVAGPGGPAPAQAPAYGYPHQGPVPGLAAAPAPAGPQGAYAAAGHGQRPRTPDSKPAVDRQLSGTGRKPRHGEPFSARALRAVRRTVSSSAAREVAEATRAAELLQQPVTTGRQIAVTSIRGGAGKSTVAALLGTTYAHYRQDPVLFVEADPALGSLPIRLGAESLRWTTGDVADIVEPQMSLLDITGYLVQLRDNAWLLPGSQGQIGAMLDTRSYERAMVALRRYFGVAVVDCETLPAEVARVALSASQARVLATPATLDGVSSTFAVLQWMKGLPPHMLASTAVVITEQAPHSGVDLADAVRTLEAAGPSVHVLPYDRHLADGGRIRTELLAHSTRQTASRLAADVFQLSQKRH
ncbi:MinD/ParA family protein [Streptomyces erythrochromogenes]|uniref:MinD/ParA family ATP-binding protein n=1 Tax=Streptomyces erythrochromogenes TaxID=285574 RepID=UPI0004CCF01A|nr:MinD/ParA family protein [Streptomyces erythrochromogenes]MCX5585379.1 MinD/ParA family protein [Streptomyces erythrochromogenes]